MEQLYNATDILCKYLLCYRINYSFVNAHNLANFKRANTGPYIEYYKCLTNELKIELKVETIALYLYNTFIKIGSNGIKYHSYVILNDLTNGVFKIGNNVLNETQINELKQIQVNYKQNLNSIVIDKIDELLTDSTQIDVIDVDFIVSEITHIPSSQTVNENNLLTSTNGITNNNIEQQQTVQQSQQSQLQTDQQTQQGQQLNQTTQSQQINPILNQQQSQQQPILLPTADIISLTNMRDLINQALNSNNNNLKADISSNIEQKLQEFGYLMITNDLAEKYLNDIEDIMIKYLRTENNMKIIKSHMDAETAPAVISHLRFPPPLLPDDRNYIDNYNIFIGNIQQQFNKFNYNQLKQKLDNHQSDLMNLKNIVKFKVNDLDNKINSIREKTENILKNEFINSDKKLKNVVNKKFEVRNTIINEQKTARRNKKNKNKPENNSEEKSNYITQATENITVTNTDNNQNDDNNNNDKNPSNNNNSYQHYNKSHNNNYRGRSYNNYRGRGNGNNNFRGRGNFRGQPHQNQSK
jgi:hypothetical protein